MKVPQNYNAGATKKANLLEEAINSNFTNQQTAKNTLPDARESILAGEKAVTSHSSQAEQNSSITGNVGSQTVNAEPVRAVVAQAIPEAEPKTPTRREVKEKFLVSMSKGERSIFKSFCALKGVSMNHFVMCAMDYFKEDLENGKVSISSHSYKRKEG
ncbi:hypothetical protein [Treponema ruminis]|uniref:Uncharacterized protein n=1 Tax=Treponema ruminis TaxID=744515 RepID=A0A7W8GAX6_9SPIR|nr:hypothetical protein [Treponema ruminis]MBB5227068.1 hypothetical protein [Treponema ruminis]